MFQREVIQIHIGQSGNQIGYSCWQLYCLEHGIYPDGTLYQTESCGEDMNAFFSVSKSGNVSPRVLFIDLEASVIGKVSSHSIYEVIGENLALNFLSFQNMYVKR